MDHLDVTPWATRLGHLLVTERFGFSEVRFPGDIPVAARSRTARYLARHGQAALDAVCEAWPGLSSLPIWDSLQRTLLRQPQFDPLPIRLSQRSPLEISSPSGEPPELLDQLLRRLAYLHDEEDFQGPGLALLTLSDAWRALRHDVDNLYGKLLEAYLDAPTNSIRMIVRFCLCTLAMDPPEQLDPLWRIGALSMAPTNFPEHSDRAMA